MSATLQGKTALQRQRAREDGELVAEITAFARRQHQLREKDAVDGPGAGLAALARAFESRERLTTPHVRSSEQALAVVAQHLQELPSLGTRRIVSLVDVMHDDEVLQSELHRAADKFRDLFFCALGGSRGISSYGDYVQGADPWRRGHMTSEQSRAYESVRLAAFAAFGVVTEDGRWVMDEDLMQLVIPAIVSRNKGITQGLIGKSRSLYEGRSQVPAFGAAVIAEVLQRLSLHFGFRQR